MELSSFIQAHWPIQQHCTSEERLKYKETNNNNLNKKRQESPESYQGCIKLKHSHDWGNLTFLIVTPESRTYRFVLSLYCKLTSCGFSRYNTTQQLLLMRDSPSSMPTELMLLWLHHFSGSHQVKPTGQSSLCPHCWLVTSDNLKCICHAHTALYLPQASHLASQ